LSFVIKFCQPLLVLLVCTCCLAPAAALTLREAETRLSEKNRDIQAARRALEAAEAGAQVANARPNPNLSIQSAGISPRNGIGSGRLNDKIVDMTIRLDQVVERGGKRQLRGDAAEKLVRAAEQDVADALRAQRLALRHAYFDLKLAQEKLAIARDFAGMSGKSLRATELRLKAGDISASDAARLRVDAMRAQNDLRSAQADLVRAQFVLASLIAAEEAATGLEASDAWPRGAALEPARRVQKDDAIDSRPDVRAAAQRVEAAEANRKLVLALKSRDITVGAQYEHFPENSGNTWGVGISIPLFVAYGYEGEIRRAENDWHAARDAQEKTRAQAGAETARTRSDIEAASERIERFRGSLLTEAKRAADAAEFAFQKGAVGVFELLEARRTFKSIQLEAANAEADFAKALAAWLASLSFDMDLQ
jgi:cobalt-zinc-cadmium efflux system outer membrane protein